MELALVGTGQMGQAVEALAGQHGHDIAARFDIDKPLLDADSLAALDGAEVVVDFSHPDVALAHMERYCAWNVTAVIGTTGWYDDLDQVKHWVDESEAALLYAPNFSVGVALMVRALRSVGPLLEQLPEYDPFVHEVHHARKADSPSGTALMLAGELLERLSRKTRIETETQHGLIDAEALHVSSTRAGDVFGQHVVALDSSFDHITFRHEAKNRQGFAFGALKSAEWLIGRQGLFTLDDVLEEWLGAPVQSENAS